jgi:hypothetical protein
MKTVEDGIDILRSKAEAVERKRLDADINLNNSTNEIVQASVDTSGVLMGDQYQVKRVCTKTDNALKAVMDAHLEKRASHYS